MILHVAVAKDGFRDVVFVEFGEELAAGLPERVDENVEPPAVGHADDDLLHAVGGAGLQQGVENGDEGLAALKGKALLTDIAGVEESFEGFGGDDFLEDAALLFRGEDGLVAVAFHPVAEPAADGEVHDVHELDAEGAAVGFAKEGEDVAEGARSAAAEGAGVKDLVEIGIGEAEGGEGEIGILVGGDAERVEVGEGVAEGAVSEEQVVEAGLGQDFAGGGGAGRTVAGRGTELAAEFEALKEAAPDGIDRGGIGFPMLVEFLQLGGVAWMAEAAKGGRWGGGGAIGVQLVENRECGIRFG